MPEAMTPEKEAEINARFQKVGEKAASVHKSERDRLDGVAPPPKPTAPPEKPRAEDGKFKAAEEKAVEKPKEPEAKKTDHIPALRDALARSVAKEKNANAAVDALKQEMAEIKALLKQNATPAKPVTPEEAQKVEAETRWVQERLMPQFAPVLEASRLILAERQAKEESNRIASENLATFERFADILDVSPEKRQEAVAKILSGEIAEDTHDATFLKALKSVSGPSLGEAEKQAADTAARERAEAEKKAATGIMGRSSPATEPANNDFTRGIADARKNKDKATEDRLIAEELTRRLYPKFQAGHTALPAE